LQENTIKTRTSFLSSVATVLSGQVGCAALGLVMEIFYARLLGPAGRGEISICMMMIGMGILVGGLGGEAPIVIWTADSKMQPSQWLPLMLVWGVAGCVLAGALWAAVYLHFQSTVLLSVSRSDAVLILLNIFAAVFSGYLMSILAGAERFRLRAGVSLADQAAALVSFLLLVVFLRRNAEMAILGNLIGLLIGAGFMLVCLRDLFRGPWKFPRIDREIVSGLSMGLRGQPGNLAGALFYRFDVFLVTFYLGPAQLGLYALGVVISEALWQIPTAVAAALLPRLARTVKQGGADFTSLIVRQVFAIACLLGVLVALASTIAVPLVFGERFRPSVPVIWWLLPGAIALSMAKVTCSDLTARFKSGYSTVFAFIAFGVCLPLDIVLIPRMGIQGAALASTGAYLTDAVLLLFALRHETKVSWRSLFVPSYEELLSYRQASLGCWLRLRSFILASSDARAGGPS
jgi:O-antigen/teichoic acid export membrane protein